MESARSEVLSLIGLDRIRSYVAAKVVRGPRARQGNVLRERIELWADGGDVVPCLFLRPFDDGHQVGAVVAVHQHAGNYALGKSELAGLGGDPQMAFAVELAESGVPTLVPDLLGFEERQRNAIDPQLAESRDAQNLLAVGRRCRASTPGILPRLLRGSKLAMTCADRSGLSVIPWAARWGFSISPVIRGCVPEFLVAGSGRLSPSSVRAFS